MYSDGYLGTSTDVVIKTCRYLEKGGCFGIVEWMLAQPVFISVDDALSYRGFEMLAPQYGRDEADEDRSDAPAVQSRSRMTGPGHSLQNTQVASIFVNFVMQSSNGFSFPTFSGIPSSSVQSNAAVLQKGHVLADRYDKLKNSAGASDADFLNSAELAIALPPGYLEHKIALVTAASSEVDAVAPSIELAPIESRDVPYNPYEYQPVNSSVIEEEDEKK